MALHNARERSTYSASTGALYWNRLHIPFCLQGLSAYLCAQSAAPYKRLILVWPCIMHPKDQLIPLQWEPYTGISSIFPSVCKGFPRTLCAQSAAPYNRLISVWLCIMHPKDPLIPLQWEPYTGTSSILLLFARDFLALHVLNQQHHIKGTNGTSHISTALHNAPGGSTYSASVGALYWYFSHMPFCLQGISAHFGCSISSTM